jgi:nucleoside 2-deoxyribosyltransferase
VTTVYLAGPINGCNDEEANGWRQNFMQHFPMSVEFLDPMVRDYRGREDDCYEEIVHLDLLDIEKCNVFLAYCWQASWGTAMEIRLAYELGCTVVVVVPEGERISPWLRYHADTIVTTLTEAAHWIAAKELTA